MQGKIPSTIKSRHDNLDSKFAIIAIAHINLLSDAPQNPTPIINKTEGY